MDAIDTKERKGGKEAWGELKVVIGKTVVKRKDGWIPPNAKMCYTYNVEVTREVRVFIHIEVLNIHHKIILFVLKTSNSFCPHLTSACIFTLLTAL